MANSGQGRRPVKTHASDHWTAELRISAVHDATEVASTGWSVASKVSGPPPTTDQPPAAPPADSLFAQREDLAKDAPTVARHGTTQSPSPAFPNPQESVNSARRLQPANLARRG